jgi:hypothetical protein
MKTALALIAVACLSGCVAAGPAFQSASPPTGGQSLVYVYWTPLTRAYSARTAKVALDGEQTAEINYSGYTYFYATARPARVTQSWTRWPSGFKDLGPLALALDLQPGETYFVELSTWASEPPPGAGQYVIFMLNARLQVVSREEAMSSITNCKYQPSTQLNP